MHVSDVNSAEMMLMVKYGGMCSFSTVNTKDMVENVLIRSFISNSTYVICGVF